MKISLLLMLLSSILFAANDFKSVKADGLTVKKVYNLLHPNIKKWKEKLAEQTCCTYKFECNELIRFTSNHSNYILLTYNELNHPDESSNYGKYYHGGWMLIKDSEVIYKSQESAYLSDFTFYEHNNTIFIDQESSSSYHGEGQSRLLIYKLKDGALTTMAELDMGNISANCYDELKVKITRKDLNGDGLADIKFVKTQLNNEYIDGTCESVGSEIVEQGSIIYK